MRMFLGVGLLILFSSCNNSNNAQSHIDSTQGLKDYYSNFFTIGVSTSIRSLQTPEADLIKKHFGSITAENAMKMKPIHPKENEYYWKDADSIVAFAKRNGLKVRGHTLVWHQAIPDWFFIDSTGKPATKELVLKRIKDHITTVVSRYKGSVYAWDVVNEAISDDKNDFYRKSKLFEICGEDFIFKAFEYAHAADPNAILFYNDYNEIYPVKRAKIITLVKKLRAAGVPVNAIGLQAHWSIYEPTKEQLIKTFQDFAELNMPLQITELDISVYHKEQKTAKEKEDDTDASFSTNRQHQQEIQFQMCFDLFRKYRKKITGVTFWDISDSSSWLNNFPVKNRKDHPLLFDRNLQPKKAFWKVALFND